MQGGALAALFFFFSSSSSSFPSFLSFHTLRLTAAPQGGRKERKREGGREGRAFAFQHLDGMAAIALCLFPRRRCSKNREGGREKKKASHDSPRPLSLEREKEKKKVEKKSGLTRKGDRHVTAELACLFVCLSVCLSVRIYRRRERRSLPA